MAPVGILAATGEAVSTASNSTGERHLAHGFSDLGGMGQSSNVAHESGGRAWTGCVAAAGARGHVAVRGHQRGALAVELGSVRRPGRQAVHVAVEEAEHGRNQHRVVDLEVGGAVPAGQRDVARASRACRPRPLPAMASSALSFAEMGAWSGIAFHLTDQLYRPSRWCAAMAPWMRLAVGAVVLRRDDVAISSRSPRRQRMGPRSNTSTSASQWAAPSPAESKARGCRAAPGEERYAAWPSSVRAAQRGTRRLLAEGLAPRVNSGPNVRGGGAGVLSSRRTSTPESMTCGR